MFDLVFDDSTEVVNYFLISHGCIVVRLSSDIESLVCHRIGSGICFVGSRELAK